MMISGYHHHLARNLVQANFGVIEQHRLDLPENEAEMDTFELNINIKAIARRCGGFANKCRAFHRMLIKSNWLKR